MKKTSIRYNNNFILMDGEKYYTTNITDLVKWKNINQPSKFKLNDVTKQIKRFIDQYKFSEKVNFIDSQSGG